MRVKLRTSIEDQGRTIPVTLHGRAFRWSECAVRRSSDSSQTSQLLGTGHGFRSLCMSHEPRVWPTSEIHIMTVHFPRRASTVSHELWFKLQVLDLKIYGGYVCMARLDRSDQAYSWVTRSSALMHHGLLCPSRKGVRDLSLYRSLREIP